jgi:hypothetical protein
VAPSKRGDLGTKRIASAINPENAFHAVRFDSDMLSMWQKDLSELENLLSASPNGLGERRLLAWFGSSTERIALLAFALHGIMPTHVARELRVGNFRTDFAWAEVAPDVDSTVGLIELEDCMPNTLFVQKERKAPYIGARFLGGFAQLVDWCAFGQAEAKSDPAISSLLGPNHTNASYVFGLVAGHRRFAQDALSHARLDWWHLNIRVGHGTSMVTFDKLCQAASSRIKMLLAAR